MQDFPVKSKKSKVNLPKHFLSSGVFFVSFLVCVSVSAQVVPQPVELNGDNVEFMQEENKFIATGNVVVIRNGTTLKCDRLEYSRETEIAVAEGSVVLDNEDGRITGKGLEFNFRTMEGEFTDAHFFSDPFYGWGEKVLKVGENHFLVENG